MELTREQALKLHKQMWTDMQRDLGDCPTGIERVNYKEKWCKEHFLTGMIANDCFLCEYAFYNSEFIGCNSCPIIWGNEDMTHKQMILAIDNYIEDVNEEEAVEVNEN